MSRPSRWLLLAAALAFGAALLASAPAAAQPLPPVVGLVINEDGNSIAVVDPDRDRVVGVHNFAGVLDKPHLAAYDPARRRLYVGNKGANLVVLDLADVSAPKVVANVKPGGSGEIHWLAIASGLVWLAHEGDSAVYAYDPADFSMPTVTLGKAEGFNTTHGVALRPGTDELWITNRPREAPGFVLRIDTRARAVIGGPLPTTGIPGDRPNNTAFTPDGRWAYVVNTGSKAHQVTVVDAAKFEVVQQIAQEPTQGLAPHAIMYEPTTRRMFVVNQLGNHLTVIDVDTHTLVDYIPVGAEPHAVSRGPDGQVYIVAKKDNKVTVIDAVTLAVRAEIVDPALVGPHYILFVAGAAPTPPTTTMPLPATGVEGAPVTFPETGYSLGGEFLGYWERHGGLPIFGYPISSEQPANGQVVQWFERARFELHPEHPAPYRVLLGRLAAEALQAQGRDWRTFPKAAPNAPHYFAQTGHAISYPPFWSFWSSHGLEFDGRRGTSMAESVALFGYPIAEPQMETNSSGDRVLTQWFERARFEYHPKNPPGARVQLGHLGAELRSEGRR